MTAWGGREHPGASHEEPTPGTGELPGYREGSKQVEGLQTIPASRRA